MKRRRDTIVITSVFRNVEDDVERIGGSARQSQDEQRQVRCAGRLPFAPFMRDHRFAPWSATHPDHSDSQGSLLLLDSYHAPPPSASPPFAPAKASPLSHPNLYPPLSECIWPYSALQRCPPPCFPIREATVPPGSLSVHRP